MPNHWIIRVGDGVNFNNSVHPFWGVNYRNKSIVGRFKPGDVLWFLVNKYFGGIFVGMAEFTHYYNIQDEPLVKINTYTNEQQGWTGTADYAIQIHYKNLYDTKKQDIQCVLVGQMIIFEYEKVKDKIIDDLYDCYKNYKKYAIVKL